jgi:N-acyl-D-amino-acid deacylase
VTTEIVGNCGLTGRTRMAGVPFDPAGDGIDCIYNLPGPTYPAGAVAATLDKMEKTGASMNTAWLFGHNDLRMMADCYTAEYTEEQFATMERYLREALEAGFIGFSTGLESIPGNLSRPEEIERLVAIVAEYDAIYTSHMRDEGPHILDSVEEFLNVIRKTGVRGQISHLNVKYDNGTPDGYLERSIQMLRDAREKEHLDVYTDMLPLCFATGMAMAILPPWLYTNGWEEARKTLADPEGRARVKADCDRYFRFLAAGQWDRLLYLKPTHMPEIGMRPFMELCRERGQDPFDVFLDVMQSAPDIATATGVLAQAIFFKEQTLIDTVIRDPLFLWESDSRTSVTEGQLALNNQNIQNYMSIAYFLVRYVRELGVISIEDAVKKLGSRPARHFRLIGRGRLEVGCYADVNVFDLNDLQIHATLEKVNQYCTGMQHVLVNGVPVILNGEHTGARSGRVLRHVPETNR